MEFTTRISYKPEHISRIYFNRKNSHLLTSVYTKLPLLTTALLTIVLLTIVLLTGRVPFLLNLIWPLGVLLTLSLGYTLYRISLFTAWKNSIQKYIRHVSQFRKITASFNDHCFTIAFDDNTYIENWSGIQSASLHTDHISMINQAGETYIFPALSLPAGDFNRIRAIIKNHVKNAESVERPLSMVPLEQVSVLLLSLSAQL